MIFYPMITMSISVARTALVVIATVIPIFFVVVFFSVASLTKINHQFIHMDQRRIVNMAKKNLARASRASFMFIFTNRSYHLRQLFTDAIGALNRISEQQDMGTAGKHVQVAMLKAKRIPAIINSNTENFTAPDLRQLRMSLGAAMHNLDTLSASMNLPRLPNSTALLYLAYMVVVIYGELASLQGIITPSTEDWRWAVFGFGVQLLLAVLSVVDQVIGSVSRIFLMVVTLGSGGLILGVTVHAMSGITIN